MDKVSEDEEGTWGICGLFVWEFGVDPPGMDADQEIGWFYAESATYARFYNVNPLSLVWFNIPNLASWVMLNKYVEQMKNIDMSSPSD